MLFSSIDLRSVTARNRLWVAPMCQYSAVDGVPTDWHLVHLGSRASGGAGLVMAEATSVTPEGRISPQDTGIWNDTQAAAWEPITAFIASQGAVPSIQLAHAGRKASMRRPWSGKGPAPAEEGGWQTVAPSPLAFDQMPAPEELTLDEIEAIIAAFAAGARRSIDVGFTLLEIHAAHGYLIHQFLSPLANQRDDDFGGSFENRTRFLIRIIDAIRKEVPDSTPVITRISATDWVDGGWDIEQSIELSKMMGAHGIDLVDVSSGGMDPRQSLTPSPGYQVPLAHRIRNEADIPTGAVGLITSAEQAEKVLQAGEADVVLMGRLFLRDPYFPLKAAAELGDDIAWPVQYDRGRP
jgi:2,4-dienoyl-CoA reductase-like NADH-dependent reductase (Old Yellow Enzyme family)